MAGAKSNKINPKNETGSEVKPPEMSVIPELIEARIEPIKEDINNFKNQIIEILAIFVALFTFVSVDIQIFKSQVSFLSATGTSLITLGALLFFIFILHFVLNNKEGYSKKYKGFLAAISIFIFLLIGGGVALICIDYYQYTEKIKDDFYEKTEINTLFINKQELINNKVNQTDFDSFKKCLEDKGYLAKQCFQ